MKILITGAAGYLGSQLTYFLVQQHHEVIAVDNLIYGGDALLSMVSQENLSLQYADVRDVEKIKSTIKDVDCLIYLAGIVGEPACNTNREVSWSINHDAAKSVLSFANHLEVSKTIFVSTCSNYGVSAPNARADESSPLNPLSDYAKAKVAVEQYLQDQYKAPCTILRLGTLCGLSARMRFDLLINEIGRSVALDQEIVIYSPKAWRPYLNIQDAVKNIARVANADMPEVTSVYNVVGQNLQKSDIVKFVKENYPTSRIVYYNSIPDLRDYRVSGDKFEQQFTFDDKTSIESTLIKIADAVSAGIFRNPLSPSHSAIPVNPLI